MAQPPGRGSLEEGSWTPLLNPTTSPNPAPRPLRELPFSLHDERVRGHLALALIFTFIGAGLVKDGLYGRDIQYLPLTIGLVCVMIALYALGMVVRQHRSNVH